MPACMHAVTRNACFLLTCSLTYQPQLQHPHIGSWPESGKMRHCHLSREESGHNNDHIPPCISRCRKEPHRTRTTELMSPDKVIVRCLSCLNTSLPTPDAVYFLLKAAFCPSTASSAPASFMVFCATSKFLATSSSLSISLTAMLSALGTWQPFFTPGRDQHRLAHA